MKQPRRKTVPRAGKRVRETPIPTIRSSIRTPSNTNMYAEEQFRPIQAPWLSLQSLWAPMSSSQLGFVGYDLENTCFSYRGPRFSSQHPHQETPICLYLCGREGVQQPLLTSADTSSQIHKHTEEIHKSTQSSTKWKKNINFTREGFDF